MRRIGLRLLACVSGGFLKAAELELMTPNDRAAALDACFLSDLSDLDPAFRARVESTGRRLPKDRGLI